MGLDLMIYKKRDWDNYQKTEDWNELDKNEIFYSRKGWWIYHEFAIGDYDNAVVTKDSFTRGMKTIKGMIPAARIVYFFNWHLNKFGIDTPDWAYRMLNKAADYAGVDYFDIDFLANEVVSLSKLKLDFDNEDYVMILSY